MDSTITELQECYDRMNSDRITDRKKGVTELQLLLERDAVIHTLNNGSKERNEFDTTRTWNSFFLASHGALLKEVERFQGKPDPKNSNTRETNKRLFMSVVTTIAKCGTEDFTYIKCATIIDAVVYVLQSPYYRNEIGCIYVNIFYECILSIPKYWSTIKLENWRNLFELFVEIFNGNPIPKTKSSFIVTIINSIIKYGCEHSSLLTEIKFRVLNFLRKIVQMTIKESIDFQFLSMKLVLTSCEKLKKECRIMICKFTEEIFDRLLDIGRALAHNDKKQTLIDILLLAVECHHPEGATQNSDIGAYAHDWDDWNRKLKQLNYVIHTELDNKQKYRKLQALPTNFVRLAVEVHNQIFRSGSNYIEVTINGTLNESHERSSSSKRRRILSGFSDVIERLKTESEPIDMWPWLSVLSSLISRYPSIVNDCDYILLLQSMRKFLSVSKEPTVTDYLCQCCMALIVVRRNGHLHIDQVEEEEIAWDSIWNLVLRTIGLNQNVEWSHKLLQHMMQYKWKLPMGNSILKLFVSEVVRISSFSVATLHQLRLQFSFPVTIQDTSVHSSLLRWLFPATSEYSSAEYFLMNLPLENYAHVIVLTCLQSNVKKRPPNLVPLEVDINSPSSISTAQVHKLSSYSCDIFDLEDEKKRTFVPEEEHASCILNQDAFQCFLNFLKDHQQSLFSSEVYKRTIDAMTDGNNFNMSDALNTIQYLNKFILFLIHIQRFVEFYVANTNTARLRAIRDETLQESLKINKYLLLKKLDLDEQINLFTHMSNFCHHLGSLPAHLIEEILKEFFPLLEPAYVFMDDNGEENVDNNRKCSHVKSDESFFETSNLSKRDRLLIESCKLLVHYSFNRNSLYDKQFEVLQTVLEILSDTLQKTRECSPAFMIMSTLSLQSVFTLKSLRCMNENVNVDLYPSAVEIIKGICSITSNSWCMTEETTLVSLKLIQKAIETSHRLNDTSKWEDLRNLIHDIKENLIPDCGPSIHIEIARCLLSFEINCCPRLTSLSRENVEILLTTSSILLKYLENPFHEVRVNITSWLPSIFALMDFIDNGTVNEITDNFFASLFSIFDVEASDDEMLDENVNCPLIVFYALASAVCNSKTTRRRQIFTLFHITQEKRLNVGLAFKIMNLVCRHLKKELNDLIKDHLEFVLFSWFEKYNSFENFPFQILGCSSIKDFYDAYMKEVVVVLYSTDPELMEPISRTLEISLRDLLKKCFPEIMAILCRKFAEARISNGNSGTITKFKHFVESTLTNMVIESMTIKNLADLLTCILRHLHDTEFQITEPGILPLPTSLVSSVRLVRETIKYLQEMMGTNCELIVYIAEEYPRFVQKIFQKLYVDVLKASTQEVKLESLQRYLLFCELLIPHHAVMSRLRINAFITRTIVTNILCFLLTSSSDIIFLKSALKFFLRFTSQWLLNDERYISTGSVFSECLTNIVNTLVIVMSRNNELAQNSLDVIRYLLSGQHNVLNEGITNLEPFPARAEFDEFRVIGFESSGVETTDTSLRNTFKSFLRTTQNSVYSPRRVESLKHLHKQLSANEFEKIQFFKRCVSSEFSENSDRSIAHHLICTIIEHTKCEDDEVKYEAVRCLCEIGLIDLHTLVLKRSCDCTMETDSRPELLITEKVCLILKDCIVDDNVDLVNAACRVLYSTLFSREGFQVISCKISPLPKSFMHPFVPRSSENVEENNLWHFFSAETFKVRVDSENLWFPVDDTSYEEWIKNLTSAVCDSFSKECFLNAIQTVCKLRVPISETIFKYLVNLLTACEVEGPTEICGRRINQFLENYFNSSSSSEESQPDSVPSSVSSTGSKNINIYNEKSSIQILLNAANIVRLNQLPDRNDLNLNYLLIAKAALHCNAYFTCALYAELYVNSLIRTHADVSYDGNILSFIEKLENKSSETQKYLLTILREAFWKIGDSDALYGCGSTLLLDSESRITHYQQIGNWQRVIESCDTFLACNPSTTGRMNDLSLALENAGFNELQRVFLAASGQHNLRSKDAWYRCAWKLAQWDIEEPCDDEKTFNYYQFAALKDIHHRNYDSVRVNVEHAQNSLVDRIARVGLESTKNVYHVLAELQCLQDIETVINVTDVSHMVERWRQKDSLSVGLNFDHKQTIFDQRVRMVDTNVEEARNFVLDIAREARREGRYPFANYCLLSIQKKELPSTLNELRVRLEQAHVLYHNNERDNARSLVKDLLKRKETEDCKIFNAILLRTYGKWLAESNLQNADTILENYFEPAAQLMHEMPCETEKECKIRAKTYKQVAEFADLQYQQLTEYIKSDEFKAQVKNVHDSKISAEALNAGDNQDMKRSKTMLKNQSNIEASQVKEIQSKEKRYLMLAFKFYLRMLAECDNEDQKVFRVISFWLDQKTNVELHKELKDIMLKIPSYKFLSVLPQLMAHLTRNTAEIFGNLLNKLLERCAHDHPHHTLPVIFSIKNYIAEEKYEGGSSASSNKNEDRVQAASDLVSQIRSKRSVQKIVRQMEEMNEAYIELAYYTNFARTATSIPIPKDKRILSIKNYENVFCPTYTVPINKAGHYTDVVGIRQIKSTFLLLGGVNAPKKIECLCTDGQTRLQMVKGKDDLRADAVMQQVFQIMNKLLKANKHTSKRKLLLRTYKIVPLSQRSGVLEFCTNTITLSQYLVGNQSQPGAHPRFRPQDMKASEARLKMKQVREAPYCTEEKRLKVFDEVCRSIKPVFRYFFVQHFPSSTVWFERKLAYIHSVATSSAVGYILGIGDRHVQNILIDQTTAEVIHIDFGVALNQGMNLTIPERVPFRLTRDIEDGMGIFSIDGIFRRCCEQVMVVLRENSEIIRTTNEVFLHDPLYQWTLTEKKCAPEQNKAKSSKSSPKSQDLVSSRALSRLKLKLQGMEDGIPTNVEGQINRLIQQAKDRRNLALIFEGWQAYL